MDIEKAYQTQIAKIQTRTGMSLDQLFALIRQCVPRRRRRIYFFLSFKEKPNSQSSISVPL